MQSTEQWLPVVGYEGIYEVSDIGNVRSLDRIVAGRRRSFRAQGRAMRLQMTPNGYLQIDLKRGGRRTHAYVHRLVALAFQGEPDCDMEVCHADGSKTNNRASNLSWGSRSTHILDQVRHGVHGNAAKTCCPEGHPYTPDNIYAPPAHPEWRECRTCIRARVKRRSVTARKS